MERVSALQRGRDASAAPPPPPTAPLGWSPADAALRGALAFFVSVCLHLSSNPAAEAAAPGGLLASALEDGLLQAVRQAELRLDGALGALREAATQTPQVRAVACCA